MTVRSLSPAKEVVGSPGWSPGLLGRELLLFEPPQKPYTFLEEKARQVGLGAGEGRKTEVGVWASAAMGIQERTSPAWGVGGCLGR